MRPSKRTTDLDRKALKRPDQFTEVFRTFFQNLAKHSRTVWLGVAVLVVLGAAIGLFQNKKHARTEEAKSALFLAEQSLRQELEALAPKREMPSMNPVNQEGEGAPEAEAETPQMVPDLEAIAFQKFDVDQNLSQGISALKSVAEEYEGTRSAYEARLRLGNLYFRHGDAEQALPWFEAAVQTAPNSFEKTMSLYSLGYAFEVANRPEDAIQRYNEALSASKEQAEPLKGDLLLAVARNYQKLGRNEEAAQTYDRILSELPSTAYAQSAEALKAGLN